MHQRINYFLIVLALSFSQGGQAQVERYLEGVHYTRLPDSTHARELAAGPGRTEVLEMFWYGCGSCYAFDPLLNAWAKQQADLIDFRRSPMIWNAVTRQHARVFFTVQNLDAAERMHHRIFEEIHERSNHLVDESAISALFQQEGIGAADFTNHFNSFAVDTALRKAETLNRELRITGVPALVVAGRYLINGSNAVPQYQDMLDVAAFLVKRDQALSTN